MTKQKGRTYPGDYVEAHPWSAAGPGWANSGIDLREPAASHKDPGRCIYTDQLGPQAYALFPVALAAINALQAALRREGYATKRPQ